MGDCQVGVGRDAAEEGLVVFGDADEGVRSTAGAC